MGDASADQYARAPTIEDVVALCRALNDAQVDYVLIGGFAIVCYGLGRFTKDVNFLVEPSHENIRRIKQALSYLPDNAVAQVADDDLQTYGVVRVGDEIVIDLLGKACTVDFQRAKQDGIRHVQIDGVSIPIPTMSTLIATKDTFRSSDHSDVAFLQALIAAEKLEK